MLDVMGDTKKYKIVLGFQEFKPVWIDNEQQQKKTPTL